MHSDLTDEQGNCNDEKKAVEEKRYAQLSRHSIKLFADAAGYAGLPDTVAALLAEGVNYRLREAAQNAGQNMRHCKRRKLTSEDFNSALKYMDVDPVYGHGNPEPPTTIYVKEAEVFCTEDKEINLIEFVTSKIVLEQPGPEYLYAQWVAVEGIPRSAPNTGTSTSGVVMRKNGPPSTQVNEDHMVYYDLITKAILGNEEELLKFAFDDLQKNAKLSPLLPYLVNFISVGVKKLNHDLVQLTKLLHIIRSLVANTSLYLGTEPYLSLLVHSVLYCILEPLAASINPCNDHWTLRETASVLLACMVQEWSNPVNQLQENTLAILVETINDRAKPFSSLYGAVVALVALGHDAVQNSLYPSFTNFLPHLTKTLCHSPYLNQQVKSDAQKVHGALLVVADIIMHSYYQSYYKEKQHSNFIFPLEKNGLPNDKLIKQENNGIVKSDNVPVDVSKAYKGLYDFFGDSLAIRLPHIKVDNIYRLKEIPPVNLYWSPELHQTAEEILESFYEKDEEMKSNNNSVDDDNSYDDNSIISDERDEHETDAVDLQIKSTISDPSIGIKLTIAKLRRPPKEEPKAKKKRFIWKSPAEIKDISVVFDISSVRQYPPYIEILFEGGYSVPNVCLHRRRFSIPQDIHNGSFARVCSKMKKTGKKQKTNPATIYRRKFLSGNLMTIL